MKVDAWISSSHCHSRPQVGREEPFRRGRGLRSVWAPRQLGPSLPFPVGSQSSGRVCPEAMER